MSSPRISLRRTAHSFLAAVLLFFAVLAVVQPSRYLSLFTSKSAVYFVCCAGIVLLYFLLREDRVSGP